VSFQTIYYYELANEQLYLAWWVGTGLPSQSALIANIAIYENGSDRRESGASEVGLHNWIG